MDAIGRLIKEWKGTSNPSVVILTDGLENASHKFTKAHIKDLIETKTKEGWTFAYLGANQDAFSEAGSIGIAPGRDDSPPMSMTDAPSASSCTPRAIAAAGSAYSPPSENESGVTLMMPMTAGTTGATGRDRIRTVWRSAPPGQR